VNAIALEDAALPTLSAALDPHSAQRELAAHVTTLSGPVRSLRLQHVEVLRHKPGRRCIVGYDVEITHADGTAEQLGILGKVRHRRYGKSGLRLSRALWNAGFDAESPDAVSVPEPLGHVPAFHMWLQRRVDGQPATKLFAGADGPRLGSRIAQAAHKLHTAGVPAEKSHTMSAELAILHQRLEDLSRRRPGWRPRLTRLLEACDGIGASTPVSPPVGVHRDFYADQVFVAPGGRLYLLDFDLYCRGDPALDMGNFTGHLTEQALRELGDPDALVQVERAMVNTFAHLHGDRIHETIETYRLLTLVRLVEISTRLGRETWTSALLALCEALIHARAGRPGR